MKFESIDDIFLISGITSPNAQSIIKAVLKSTHDSVNPLNPYVYATLVDLIDKFSTPYSERNAARLFHAMKDGGGRVLDISSNEEKPSEESQSVNKDLLDSDSLLEMLEGRLDNNEFRMLRILTENSGFQQNRLDVENNIPEIRRRLEILVRISYESGIMYPTSSSVYVDFTESDIRFLNSRRGVSPEQIEKLKEAHEKGMTLTEAADYVGIKFSSARRPWHLLGFKTFPRKELSTERKRRITWGYTKGESISGISRFSGSSRTSVAKYLRSRGLNPYNPGVDTSRIDEGLSSGMSLERTAIYAGTTVTQVAKRRDEQGLKSDYYLDDETKRLIVVRAEQGAGIKRIAKELGISPSTAWKYSRTK